jgi:hypothetical protein
LDLIPPRQTSAAYRITEGSWAPCYGRKIAAPVVCQETHAALPAEFATAISASQASAGEPGEFEQLVETGAPTQGLSAYEYRDESRRILALFFDGEGGWRWREWSSDAAFLAVETDAGGAQYRRVFLAGGSRLESAAGPVLQCRIRVDCWEWIRGAGGEQVYCSHPEAVEPVVSGALASLRNSPW